MSVINETLDNLKKTKKRASNLNPASSSMYHEKSLKSENAVISPKAYFVPLGFALLVGLLFYISHVFFSGKTTQSVRKNEPSRTLSWFKPNLHKQTVSKQNLAHKPSMIENKAAQNMYYDALVLLNEGKDAQALQRLQTIIERYPDFAPAQKVHAMLMTA